MTRKKNLDTTFNRYRRLANPWQEKYAKGERLLREIEDTVLTDPTQWDEYQAKVDEYRKVQEDANVIAEQLNALNEEMS